ncbi:MAG: ATP-binding protein [Cyanobacteriota bacterium ELA615]
MQRLLFPLRFSIPTILILFGGLLGFFSFRKEIAESYQRTEHVTEDYVEGYSRTAGVLDYLFRRNDKEEAEILISQLASDPYLDLVLLFDHNNQVFLASNYQLRNQPIQKTSAANYLSKFKTIRANKAANIFFTKDRKKIIAIFPVLLAALPGELNPSRVGILYLQYDMTATKRQAYLDALYKSLAFSTILTIFCLLLWFFFELALTRRVARLVNASNKLAEGDLSIRTGILGNDEVGNIAKAFDRMAQRIQKNTKQLEDSEQRYNLAVSGTNDGIWDWDLTTDIVYYSPVWLEILGYCENDHLSFTLNTYLDNIHVEDRLDTEKAINNHLSGNSEIYQHIHRMQHREKYYLWIEAKGKCLLNQEKKPYRMVGTINNITDKKHIEEELQKAKETAEIANAAKSQFLAKMTHELRTPLTAIIGFGQLIINRDKNLSDSTRQYIDIVNRSGEHLLSLINDVLSMSQIEAEKISIGLSSFDLYQLFDLVQSIFIPRTRSNGIELKLEVDSLVPQYIKTDQAKLRQILLNLIGNAVKFTSKGYVLVRVKYKQQKFLEIEVIDTGTGIASGDLESVFQAFEQAEQGRSYNEGTGLGLAISRQFARLLGGDITLESTLGVGSTFCCTLEIMPAENIQLSQTAQEVIGLAPNQIPSRILVVEDNLEISQLLLELIGAIGLQVKSAQNGIEALEIWKNWQPDLIWMDIQIPIMDGYETTGKIRNSPQGDKTKIIALSANAFIENQSFTLEAGFDDYVTKPFSKQIIFERMASHLDLEYTYESDKIHNPYFSRTNKLEKEGLETLDKDLLRQIKEAAILLDEQQIQKLISLIPKENSKPTEILSKLLKNFQFEEILEIIEIYL